MATLKFNPIPLSTLTLGTPERPFALEELAQTSYRPTLIIGLGGTGAAVLRRLKQRMRRSFSGDHLKVFQFLAIDTTAQEVPEGETPLDAGEFLYLGALDAADLISHLSENPYIARWWPGGLDRPYRPRFSGVGASRVRPVGRLVLFNYMSSVILPAIAARLKTATEVNAQHGVGATSIKIYIVCSLAGGTGSAMLIDVAYCARMLALRCQPTAFVTGVLVLDDAFTDRAQTTNTASEYSANAFAALRELNYFAQTRRFREHYDDLTDTEELADGYPPLDMSYLVGLSNARGQALDSFESLTDMISAYMMAEIASPLENHTNNVLDNVHANDRAIAGQPAAYSSFAVSSLVYPLEGVASWCALNAYGDFTDQVLLAPRRPASDVEHDVLDFAQRSGIEQEQASALLDRLNLDDKDQALAAPALSYDQVAGLPDDQTLGGVQRLTESALDDLAHAREAIARRVPRTIDGFAAALRAEAEAVLRDPQRGPAYAAWFLGHLAQRLADQRDQQLSPGQAAYHAEADQHAAEWRAAQDRLARALGLPRWVPFLRRWLLNNARASLTSAFNAHVSAAHQTELHAQALACSSAFLQLTRAAALRASDLVSVWTETAQTARAQAAAQGVQRRALETEYSLVHSIVGPGELERTFRGQPLDMSAPAQRDRLAGEFWEFFAARAPGWHPEDGRHETPVEQTYCFLAAWYGERLGTKSLLERLKEIYGANWAHEVELHYRQTAPFWNYNLARFGDRIRSNLQHEPRLVGYGEPDIQAWSQVVAHALGERIDAVSNNNPHEMLFVKTSHGLPLFALRSIYQVMLHSYRYLRRLWDHPEAGSNPIPLHISTIWESALPDIDPVVPAVHPLALPPTDGKGTTPQAPQPAGAPGPDGNGTADAGRPLAR